MIKSGIYKLFFNSCPEKFYIGSAINLNERKARHRHLLKKGIHRNIHLQRLCNKLGVENMVFEILEITNTPEHLLTREQFYIDSLNPTLNILLVAGSVIGYRHSEKIKLHLSSINTGKKMTPEQNSKNSIAQLGNKNARGCNRSSEFRKHLSKIRMRKVINTETMKVFDSVGHAAVDAGVKYSTLYAKLKGTNINNTNFSFL